MLRVAIAQVHDEPVAGDDVAPAWMGDAEQRRWMALSPAARREFVASRALLRELLRAATGVPRDGWRVSAEAGTAPVASPLRAGLPGAALHVSLSHRLGWVAAAACDAAVGVDIEHARPARSDPAERAALMLSSAELPAWHALAPDERESALLTCWTAKEAWFKARPPATAPWDFRQVIARACAPAHANVRVWDAAPLQVAVCCADALALARAECEGLAAASARSSFWRVDCATPVA